jgi:5,5'-dehydrodivanillate O-demethylase oxygenase subunit
MLSAEQNRLLTEVGPGTPMGNYLRRYWQPIAAVSELDKTPTKPLRLMGEDLVLYKDLSGHFGLLDRHCPHRRADLSYGYVEMNGLRCNYHGWCYDKTGACIAQPYEDVAAPAARFKEKIRIKNYPVKVAGGLLWTYLGPQPAPELPEWEPFSWRNGFKQIVFANVPCNWLQCQENSIDPVHFEWMHSNWSVRLSGRTGPYVPKHLEVDFEEFEFGLIYKRLREDTDKTNDLWTVGRVALWPNGFYLGEHFEWRVPIDDENTLSVTWAFNRVPNESEPFEQNSIPAWWGPIKDDTGRWITSHVMNQDFVAWVGQGVIADRTKEHLGASDRGVLMMRRRFFAELDAIAQGKDAKGIIRDPARAKDLRLPCSFRDAYINGRSRAAMTSNPALQSRLSDYIFQAGQPAAIRDAFRAAMGF